ncbi:uncharacterized protein LOC136096750 [Hydra vulgaris]|uniref:uncharacterized protein LOC136096750 n=1 Tax=Hydra vulgaris TaxID=6087 RepID=UPI0032EA6DDD
MAMYENVTTTIKTRDGQSDSFKVKVSVHQGSVLSSLLFIFVLEAFSKEFKVGLPWELFYADNLCLIAENRNRREIICRQLVHKRCSGIQGSLKIVGFEYRKPILDKYREVKKDVEIKSGGKIKCVIKFSLSW